MTQMIAVRALADYEDREDLGKLQISKIDLGILCAIDDVRTLIAHTKELFRSDIADESGLTEWLEIGDEMLREFFDSILNQKMKIPLSGTFDSYADTADLDDHFLNQRWSAEALCDVANEKIEESFDSIAKQLPSLECDSSEEELEEGEDDVIVVKKYTPLPYDGVQDILYRNTEFWVDEICNRVALILHFLFGDASVLEAAESYSNLRKVRFPAQYGVK